MIVFQYETLNFNIRFCILFGASLTKLLELQPKPSITVEFEGIFRQVFCLLGWLIN